jgi:DNA-binding CsgD family transcriptional regulator
MVKPVLYGRDDDLALISGLIDRVCDGGAALLICGEPGIGKSALLESAQGMAWDRGMRVVQLCGAASEIHLPFGALQQAIGGMLQQIEMLPARQRSAMEAVFGLGDDAAAPDVFLVALAALTLLTASAAHRPILMVADDIQWLDQPSLDVLAFISRRLGADPIVLLMAARRPPEEAFPALNVSRHRLSPLSAEASARLLDAGAPTLPPDLRRRFLEDAAGNPLALVELPRGEPKPPGGEPRWLPLTDRLESAFLNRFSDLPEATRALLLVIAENDSRSLREVLDAGELLLGKPAGLDALVPAVSAMLIEMSGGEVRCRHPLVRSAIHQAASPVMRHEVHAALARVIRDQPDRRLWHRMISTIEPDEDLAGELDAAATRSQRRGGLATAITALENAARLSETAEARSKRLLQAAELGAALGRPETVERLLREAQLDDLKSHLRARSAWVREISQPLTVNDPGRALALIGFAAEAQSHGESGLAVKLLWRAAQRCWWSNSSDQIRTDIHVAALKLGLPSNDARLIAIASYVEPLANGYEVNQQLAAHDAAGVKDPVDAWILALAGNVVGGFNFSSTWLVDVCAAFREQGRLGDLARSLFSRGCAETENGNWRGAMESAAESARFGEETGQIMWVAAATALQSMLAGRRGQFDAAEIYAGQAEQLMLTCGASFYHALLQQARAIAAFGAGRPGEAYEHLRRVWTPGDPAYNTGLQFYCLPDYVEAAVSCGQVGIAGSVIEEIERRSGPVAVPWVRMALAYCKALVAAPDRAEPYFQEALGGALQAWPFRRGCCLLAYGAWLRRQRRIMEARAPLRAARDIFDALGAAPRADEARRELRAAGESSRPRQAYSADLLTPQELQIAELAASGLSNKEIGIRLYLSHRTVGYHLYRIFPKLGVTTRSGLLAALRRPQVSA